MLEDCKRHPNHVVLAAGLIMIGTWLLLNDHFFTWPPGQTARAIENNPFWGWLLIILGLAMLAWLYLGATSIAANRFLLTASAGVMGFLTAYEFLIWVATGMYESWISNLIITGFVLVLARGSDTKNDEH